MNNPPLLIPHSDTNPSVIESKSTIRMTKSEKGFTTEAQAMKRELQLKKEGACEMFDLDSKGIVFSDLVDVTVVLRQSGTGKVNCGEF